ncbi:MAG: hypothetical protein CMF01_11305 [Hyphomonas sp.]|nr:hypothetical protein [Hyphomonas sp.]
MSRDTQLRIKISIRFIDNQPTAASGELLRRRHEPVRIKTPAVGIVWIAQDDGVRCACHVQRRVRFNNFTASGLPRAGMIAIGR